MQMLQSHRQVRCEQAAVLMTLRRARGAHLTTEEIARRLNYGVSAGNSSLVTPQDVESTLAALSLRADLQDLITVRTRIPAPAEQAHRLALGVPLLASVVFLSACALPLHRTPSQHQPSLSYFGSSPSSKGDLPATHQVFVSNAGSLCSGTACDSVFPPPETFTAKTLANPTDNVSASYFPRASESDVPGGFASPAPTLYAAREEATIIEPPTPSQPTLVSHTSSLESASFAEIEEGLSTDRALITAALASAFSPHDKTASTASLLSTPDRSYGSAPSAQSAPISSPVSSEDVKLTSWFADDHYVIPFSNGSQRLTHAGRGEAAAIAALAQHVEKVELRGRVGNRVLKDQDGRLAMGRALAVRSELVAAGVPLAKIKIRLPREDDLLDRDSFDSPLNMSVSVQLRAGSNAVASAKAQPQAVSRT